MKRTIALTATLIMLLGTASAIADYNGSAGEGEYRIMSGGTSSASGSTAAGPNGTLWSVTVSMAGSSPTSPADSVGNVSYSSGEKYRVEFTGEIVAPTPCHVLDHSVEERNGSSYVLNVKTVRGELDNGTPCTQVVTGIDYDASFETDSAFRLEVRHDGETVETLEHPDFTPEEQETHQDSTSNPFTAFMDWFAGLF